MSEYPRLLILTEERLLGRGLALLLSSYETHLVESFERAGRLLTGDRREIVLWVGDRVDAATVERLEELRRLYPGTRLCVVAHTADAEALRPMLTRVPDGVAVLLRTHQLDVDELLASLEDVVAGRSTLEPRILEQLLANGARSQDPLASLTGIEQEILELVALGLRNREIARRLWKSEKAVEKQVSHVFAKLGLDAARQPHLDRRVTAARIFVSCRPQTPAVGTPK